MYKNYPTVHQYIALRNLVNVLNITVCLYIPTNKHLVVSTIPGSHHRDQSLSAGIATVGIYIIIYKPQLEVEKRILLCVTNLIMFTNHESFRLGFMSIDNVDSFNQYR